MIFSLLFIVIALTIFFLFHKQKTNIISLETEEDICQYIAAFLDEGSDYNRCIVRDDGDFLEVDYNSPAPGAMNGQEYLFHVDKKTSEIERVEN